jgi:DNA-binding protein YbaB
MKPTEIIIYTIISVLCAGGIVYAVNKTNNKHKTHKEDKEDKEYDDTYGKDFISVTASERNLQKTNSDDIKLREAEYALKKAEKELLKTKTPSARFEASEKVDKLQKKFIKVSSLKHPSRKGGSLNKKTRNKCRK